VKPSKNVTGATKPEQNDGTGNNYNNNKGDTKNSGNTVPSPLLHTEV
jgi:hypothetical protein